LEEFRTARQLDLIEKMENNKARYDSANMKLILKNEEGHMKNEEIAMRHVQKIMKAEATVRERFTDAQIKAMELQEKIEKT